MHYSLVIAILLWQTGKNDNHMQYPLLPFCNYQKYCHISPTALFLFLYRF